MKKTYLIINKIEKIIFNVIFSIIFIIGFFRLNLSVILAFSNNYGLLFILTILSLNLFIVTIFSIIGRVLNNYFNEIETKIKEAE